MKRRGFTLLETLVALAILAVALAAAFRAMGVATRSAAELRERTLAELVADNRLAELRASRAFPPPGGNEGEALQAGQRFRWREDVSATPDPLFRRVEVRVFRAGSGSEGAALAHLSGFVVQPLR
ncbi:type II secretion system minor pseudopilin GspI [Rhodocyclus purpureus]|uniref:type II secretion system minor pseudopilin GspI n=1 Tax=Rhodocyclus purpureus TaxID=1067 RepID=UPI001913933D|nr:type II secretion system minor pseudopilin GspI [Rhodocyclus purpureus]MBK5915360.1 type II secretion system protein GspI [Rhodocyclus purpureus]